MIFFGGVVQIIAAIGEWILGNTFSMCLFFTYGTFWVVTGTQLIPWFNVGAQYSMPIGDTIKGMEEPSYYATVGEYFPPRTRQWEAQVRMKADARLLAFYYLALAMLTTIFTVCALRTNVVLFSALFTLIFAFACAAGAFWNLAEGNVESGVNLTIVSPTCGLVS